VSGPRRIPRVLSIAGTDPTGGAGIHADLKTIAALGGYGMAVITALVAQNTTGVREVHVPPPAFLRAQLDAVGEDVGIDAVKLGMLHSAPLIEVVGDWLAGREVGPVVLDPVMVATSGDRLLDREAEAALRRLCARADLVTPNLPELAVLAGEPVAREWDAAVDQAARVARDLGATVLLKGGHLAGAACPDALVAATGVIARVDSPRVETTNTHGTGCSLSSAMATLRASGRDWPVALERAKSWLGGAIAAGAALEVGRGNGPVDHLHELRGEGPRASARPHAAAPAQTPAETPAQGETPTVGGAGAWTAAAWDAVAQTRARVDGCAFVRGLREGDLPADRFAWYLAQDAVYLGEYARVLARTSALAPDAADQAFWARSAASAVAVEAELHRSRIGSASPAPAPATRAYTDHLHATSVRGSYAELAAALLPCFWLYADLGERLAAANHPGHAYRDWLTTYADPGFAASTRAAIGAVERAAAAAGPAERERMGGAFLRSMELELAFFEAPLDPTGASRRAAGGVREPAAWRA